MAVCVATNGVVDRVLLEVEHREGLRREYRCVRHVGRTRNAIGVLKCTGLRNGIQRCHEEVIFSISSTGTSTGVAFVIQFLDMHHVAHTGI